MDAIALMRSVAIKTFSSLTICIYSETGGTCITLEGSSIIVGASDKALEISFNTFFSDLVLTSRLARSGVSLLRGSTFREAGGTGDTVLQNFSAGTCLA